jgi:trans-2,3-dihydro-3-hydroxyanthranilic acid synthase
VPSVGLPKIPSYSMPREDELPRNVAPWRIDPRRSVLLIHDMQRYFLGAFPAGRQPVVDLVANVDRLRRSCASAGVPVVYTAQPGGMAHRDRGLLRDFWGAGMRTAPEERGIVDSLAPTPRDRTFVKWRYTAFHRNGLLHYMRAEERDQLVICGVYAHVGCLMTACDAFTNDIQPFLVADAMADFTEEQHRSALAYAAELCAVVLSTRTAIRSLREQEPPAAMTA